MRMLCVDIIIVAKHMTGVLFLVQFNNFDLLELHALTLAAHSYALLSCFRLLLVL